MPELLDSEGKIVPEKQEKHKIKYTFFAGKNIAKKM